VAAPSRLYFTPSTEEPLAGLRIAVKDIFHLNGLQTTCGNRSYGQLHPRLSVTSPVVQKAIDLGAIVLGKTKLAEFAGSQEVVGDWAEFSYAFNARADGYLVSTGSSTGSAAAVAAYSWIDIAIGTDGKFREAKSCVA
jgi:Asp-tRNA(Asn)/Glu-tRNA(Gln) amidotransferase A subunit family amidase